ncbi:hypothetical protein [Streptomyces sp. NPDC046759]|uniref:hypothetical protein n=1 Tax=Streptomyces sp. NPDC046759 TaxID=3155019 RepID=UPI0034006CE4
MEKLAHRIGIATASLAVAAGAFLASSGSASAAAFPADTAQSGVVAETGATGWNHGGYGGVRSEGYRHHREPSDGHCGRYAYDRFYPWVWDQLTELGHVN